MDKWLGKPNVVKIVALVLGILLWVIVNLEEGTAPGATPLGEREEKIYNVSITPKYDESKYYIQSIEPSEVMVSLRGKESALRKVTSGSYKVELDLTSVGKGEFILPLQPIDFPSAVKVEIVPQSVKVVLEERERKEMPVIIQLMGNPAEDFKAGQPIINPSRVHITMPSSRLGDVASVRADVSIEGARTSVVRKVKLIAYDQDGHEIDATITPAVVDVEIPITSPFKAVPLQLKIINEPPEGFSIAALEQSIYQVTAYGKQEILDQLEFYEGPVLDLSGLNESKEISLDIALMPSIMKVEPAKVEVLVTIVPSVTKQLDQIPITLIGHNEGFDTEIMVPGSGRIDLKLEGAPSLIEQVNAQDIQVFVDVSNLPPGEHIVKMNVNLPTFIKNAQQSYIWATIEIRSKQDQDEDQEQFEAERTDDQQTEEIIDVPPEE